MRDVENRQRTPASDFPDAADKLLAQTGIERSGRFVENEHSLRRTQCSSQRYALRFAPGERTRHAIKQMLDMKHLHQIVERNQGRALSKAHRILDVVGDVEIWKEPVILKDESDLSVLRFEPNAVCRVVEHDSVYDASA